MSETNNSWSNSPNQAPKLDPGIDSVTFAHNNMNDLVAKISGKTLEELTLLRDEIDSLMISIRTRNEQIIQDIVQYTEFCIGAIKTKQIVSDSVRAIKNDFNGKPMVVTSKLEHQ